MVLNGISVFGKVANGALKKCTSKASLSASKE